MPTPPPLYIHDKAQWTAVSKACAVERINYTHARTTAVGIKVQVVATADFRSLTKLLKERKVAFHTYALKEDRQFRCVIKHVAKEIAVDEIAEDLKSQGFPVLEVHRMHRGRNGAPFDMIIVILENTVAGKAICDIKSVCSLSGIKVERPHKTSSPGQCHNCQLYGHAQRNCYAKARCVKCLGDHATAACTRPKEVALCTEPPSCVLCGESGHPASYRGCPKAPRSNRKAATSQPKRQHSKLPLINPTPPMDLRPQRPSPWNVLNHQQAFPALRPTQTTPATIPPLMALPISPPTGKIVTSTPSLPRPPVPARKPTSQSAQVPRTPQPVHTPHTEAPYDPATIMALARFFDPNIIARSNELHAKLIASKGNLQANMALMAEYSDLSTFFIHYTP